MFKWIFIASMMLLSCKAGQQKAQAQEYINGLRQLDSATVRHYHDTIAFYMDTMLNRDGFSGGILVAKNGTILYEHYQGFSDAAGVVPINDSTPFHVASTSKTFTSHAVLQLVQQGKLHLSDTVQQFFPRFPYKGITIKHLLSHNTGLPNYAYFFPKYGWDKKRLATNEDVLNMMVEKRPPLNAPVGSRFEYSNTNFVLLALIVEQVSGQPFPQYVKEHIFDVAGMDHSFIMGLADTGRYLPSFTHNRIRVYNLDAYDAIYGDKNVYTTCRDLMLYDAAIRDHQLLDSASYAMAWEPLQFDAHYGDSSEHYGLGWRLKVYPSGVIIPYHNGWWHGNNAIFQRLIKDTAVIIVTGNVFNRRIYHTPHVANFFRQYYDETNMVPNDKEIDPTTIKEDAAAVSKKKKGQLRSKHKKSKARRKR